MNIHASISSWLLCLLGAFSVRGWCGGPSFLILCACYAADVYAFQWNTLLMQHLEAKKERWHRLMLTSSSLFFHSSATGVAIMDLPMPLSLVFQLPRSNSHNRTLHLQIHCLPEHLLYHCYHSKGFVPRYNTVVLSKAGASLCKLVRVVASCTQQDHLSETHSSMYITAFANARSPPTTWHL